MPTKPFKEYSELLELLKQRQMIVHDEGYALKKLTQVGYYRLSGFWHIARQAETAPPYSLLEDFLPNTDFNQVYRLYIFDKKLRLLLLDIIERLEIHLRSVIAHEMSRHNPLAYQNSLYINPKYSQHYQQWQNRLNEKIAKSRDDFVKWHKQIQKPLPFWAVVELWDFGMLSKYYSMLNKRHQNQIAKRFNIDNTATLISWLNEINILRNQSAHHSRIWNRKNNPIKVLDNPYFAKLDFNDENKRRLFSRIAVLWYLIKQSSQNYHWLDKIYQLIEQDFPTLPNAKLSSMGYIQIPNEF